MPHSLDSGWRPDWPATGVGAWMSTRRGGSGAAPFNTLNLGSAVGDEPDTVLLNRQHFQCALEGAVPVFLKQVHGVRVVRLSRSPARVPKNFHLRVVNTR